MFLLIFPEKYKIKYAVKIRNSLIDSLKLGLAEPHFLCDPNEKILKWKYRGDGDWEFLRLDNPENKISPKIPILSS